MSEAPTKKQKMSDQASTSHQVIFDPDLQDFAQVKLKPTFVDHTELIKIFLADIPNKLIVTAPSHFCKSTNLDMLRLFFERKSDGTVESSVEDRQSYHVFEDTKIMQIDTEQHRKALTEHFCAHPVLRADFRIPNLKTYKEAQDHILRVTLGAYRCYESYLEANLDAYGKECFQRKLRLMEELKDMAVFHGGINVHLEDGLETLCNFLYKASGGKGVFILIDNADAPVTAALNSGLDEQGVLDIAVIMTELLGRITKGDIESQLLGVLITGISYFKYPAFSSPFKAASYRFLDESGDFYGRTIVQTHGLTRLQLEDLLKKLQANGLLKWDTLENIKQKIDDNYNGYLSSGGVPVYSLWSVLHYLQSQKTSPVHADMVPIAKYYRNAFKNTSVGTGIIQLIAGEEINIECKEPLIIDCVVYLRDVKKEVMADSDTLFSLLMDVGFLTYSEKGVRIPNKEVRTVFIRMIVDNQIQFGNFNAAHQQECANEVANMAKASRDEDEASFKLHLKSLYEKLTTICQQFSLYSLKECYLQVIIMLIMQYSDFKDMVPEYCEEDHGYVDVWSRNEELSCTCVWEVKVNEKRAEEKTSMWAMKEMHGDQETTKKGYVEAAKKTENFLLLGLSVDEERKPSICVQTRGKEKGIFVSETERDIKNFARHYQGWYDLLKEDFVPLDVGDK